MSQVNLYCLCWSWQMVSLLYIGLRRRNKQRSISLWKYAVWCYLLHWEKTWIPTQLITHFFELKPRCKFFNLFLPFKCFPPENLHGKKRKHKLQKIIWMSEHSNVTVLHTDEHFSCKMKDPKIPHCNDTSQTFPLCHCHFKLYDPMMQPFSYVQHRTKRDRNFNLLTVFWNMVSFNFCINVSMFLLFNCKISRKHWKITSDDNLGPQMPSNFVMSCPI